MTKNICLLHGWGGSPEKLGPLENELKSLGWNTFSPGLPFLSLPDAKTAWDLNDYADYVYKQCQKKFKGQKYYLFGHSNGGRISIRLANKKEIIGLILCSSAGISRTPFLKRIIFQTITLIFMPLKKFPDLYQHFRKLIYMLSRNYDYYKITTQLKKDTFRLLIQENLKEEAKKIKKPVLIVWGTSDKMTPIKDAYWLKKNLTDSSLKTFKSERHAIPYTKFKEIAKYVETWH